MEEAEKEEELKATKTSLFGEAEVDITQWWSIHKKVILWPVSNIVMKLGCRNVEIPLGWTL
jgi:hypothetical protein